MLKLMGFKNMTYDDIHLYRIRYKNAREEVRKLGHNLNERSKSMKFSSTMDEEEITSEDI